MVADVVDVVPVARVRQHHAAALVFGREADEAAGPAGAAVLPDDVEQLAVRDEPAQRHIGRGFVGGPLRRQQQRERLLQRRRALAHRRLDEGAEVVGGRAQRARAGEDLELPVRRREQVGVVRLDATRFHRQASERYACRPSRAAGRCARSPAPRTACRRASRAHGRAARSPGWRIRSACRARASARTTPGTPSSSLDGVVGVGIPRSPGAKLRGMRGRPEV